MDGHSKREVLEILNMNEKKFIARFLLLNRNQFENYLRFLAKWSRDVSQDLLTQYLYFKMLSMVVP